MLNQNEQKVTVNMADAKSMACQNVVNPENDICGCELFDQSYIIKVMSAIQSPTGREIEAPIPVFTCRACGAPIMLKQ